MRANIVKDEESGLIKVVKVSLSPTKCEILSICNETEQALIKRGTKRYVLGRFSIHDNDWLVLWSIRIQEINCIFCRHGKGWTAEL